MGHPRLTIDPAHLSMLAFIGCPLSDAARMIGASQPGLRKFAIRHGIEFKSGRGSKTRDLWRDPAYRARQVQAIREGVSA